MSAISRATTRWEDREASDAREVALPLSLGLVVAIVLLAAGVPWFNTRLQRASHEVAERSDTMHRPSPAASPMQPAELRLGRNELETPTVAWLSVDDYRELKAPRTKTTQPVTQQDVDPVEQAPPRLDATPPAPQAQPAPASPSQPPTRPAEAQPPTPPTPEAPPVDPQPQPTPPPPRASGLPDTGPDADVPHAPVRDTPPTASTVTEPTPDRPPSPDAPSTPDRPTPSPAEPQPDTTPTPPQPPATAASNPTSAPRTEEDLDAAHRAIDSLRIAPGQVRTGPGIEITTARPEIGVPARFLAMGLTHNPVASLVFNHDGEVINVTWKKPTGIENLDAPLLASLYRWKARGRQINDMDKGDTLTIEEMELIIVRER